MRNHGMGALAGIACGAAFGIMGAMVWLTMGGGDMGAMALFYGAPAIGAAVGAYL